MIYEKKVHSYYETATKPKQWGHNHELAKMYRRARWRKLRALILGLNPFCVKCKEEGKTVEARVVDHIKEIDINSSDALKYGEDNLQPLCHSCHNSKTAKHSNR